MTIVWDREWVEELGRKTLGELLYVALVDLSVTKGRVPRGLKAATPLGEFTSDLKACS